MSQNKRKFLNKWVITMVVLLLAVSVLSACGKKDDGTAANKDLRTKEQALTRANEVLNKLKKGGDFAALAKEYSDDPGSKDAGGTYKDVDVNKWDPAFRKAAVELPLNTLSDPPVESSFGYHIMKVEKREASPLETVKPNIKSDLVQASLSEFAQKELPGLIETNNLPTPTPASTAAPNTATPSASGNPTDVIATYKGNGKVTRAELDTFMNVNTLFQPESKQFLSDPAYQQEVLKQLITFNVLSARADAKVKEGADKQVTDQLTQIKDYLGKQEGGMDKALKDNHVELKDVESLVKLSFYAMYHLESKVTDQQIQESYTKRAANHEFDIATVSHILISVPSPAASPGASPAVSPSASPAAK